MKITAVEQVSVQGSGPAEVMGHDIGALESPVSQKLREHLVLHAERDILAIPLFGLPVAEQVENEHLAAFGKIRGDPVPDVGGERRAMGEDNRRPLAKHVVAYRLPTK